MIVIWPFRIEKLLLNYLKNPNQVNLIKYRKPTSKAQWTLKQVKRKFWQDFVAIENSAQNSTSLPINVLIDDKIDETQKMLQRPLPITLAITHKTLSNIN